MNILQISPVPDGLLAVYVVILNVDSETTHVLMTRPVDCMALVEVDQKDARAVGDVRRARQGKGTKLVGIIAESAAEPMPAPDAQRWMEVEYGDTLVGGRFLGYTRLGIEEGSHKDYWVAAAKEAAKAILQ